MEARTGVNMQTAGVQLPTPSVISKDFAQPSIFKTAWNLLNNIRDELTQEPVTLIRTITPSGSNFVKAEDQTKAFRSDSGNGNYPTIESYASTLPFEIQITAPKESAAKVTKPQSPLPEVFNSDICESKKGVNQKALAQKPGARSLPGKHSSTTTTAEKKSSSGINCILDENDKPAGTHRTNQAESSAQEYQQLLDGVQSHYPFLPENSEKKKSKGLRGTRSFARLSDLYPDATNCHHSIRISDGQFFASEDDSKQHGTNRVVPCIDNYLETVNDQLFRMNHERKRRQMSGFGPMNHNLLGRSNGNNNSGQQQNDYGISQNNNVNINLTLALNQIQQGGQYEVGVAAVPDAVGAEIQELKAPRPQPLHAEAKVRNSKVETSMQTELGVQGDAEGSNATSEVPSRTPSTMKGTVHFSPEEFQPEDSTSAFPSTIPSAQNWKRRQPQPIPDINGPQDSWSNYIDFPAALTYTNDSLRSFLESADEIVSTCIILPDDNPMSDEEMNADEDRVAISVMRLLGIPQQIRHNIYKEALHNITAIQEVSCGTVDVLSNVIDWLSNGNCGGKEEILSKARLLASITTDFDPESEVWTQFEKDIGIFTDAVGVAMKDGYEVGKEVVKKCSETLIQRMNSSTSIGQPVAIPLSCNPASQRESLRRVCISEEERNSEVSRRTPPRPSNCKIRSNSLGRQVGPVGRQVGPVRCKASSPPSLSPRIVSPRQGRDQYRKDPLEALDVEIQNLNKIKEELQSQTTLSSVNTPAHPWIDACGNYALDSGQSEDEESLASIEEPVYPNIKLLDGDSEPEYCAQSEADQSNFSLRDDAEKRHLLRQCRVDARRLTDDISNRRNSVVCSNMEAFSRVPSRQRSEESEVVPEYYPRRVTDALLEAPPGYDFGITTAITSACGSIKSSILSQAQSAAKYFPVFQDVGTPILGQSPCESRDERMEFDPRERYNPDWTHKVRLMGRTASRPRFGSEDYYDNTSDSGIPEPTSPAPPPIPRRHQQSFEVHHDDARPTPRENIGREGQLAGEEQLFKYSTQTRNEELPGSQRSSTSICPSLDISDCSTPQHPLLDGKSLSHSSAMPTAVAVPSNELSDLMQKLKPHWPTTGSALTPDQQVQIAMNNFISAQSHNVPELMASSTVKPKPLESPNPLVDLDRSTPPEVTVAKEMQVESLLKSPNNQISSADHKIPMVNMNNGNSEKLEDIVLESKEESQLQKELNQLEKIVQDMCSEVTGTKLEPSLSLLPDDKPQRPTWSRIPTPNHVRTPFALPRRNKESATTIDLYSPKAVMNAASCLSVDSSLVGLQSGNFSSYGQNNSTRNNNRTSAFGRSINSSPHSASKLKQASVNLTQRTIQAKKVNGPPQRKPVYTPGKLTTRVNGNKWTALASPRAPQTYRKLSAPPSREESKTALVSRTNSYRQLFQMKQTLVAKTTGPIHLRKTGAQPNRETQRGTTAGYASSRSRGRTPLILSERYRSFGRGETAPAPAVSGQRPTDNVVTPADFSGGYLMAHGSGSRLNIQTNVADTNSNQCSVDSSAGPDRSESSTTAAPQT